MRRYWIIVLGGFILLVLVVVLLNLLKTPQESTELSVKEAVKDCGSEIDKPGATHALNRDCFAKAFKTCTPAKINQESFPPDNAPSIKTSIQVEGQTDKGCRIQVSVHNTLAFPEDNIYYCYKAEKGIADDTLSKDHLIISECDNNKRIVF